MVQRSCVQIVESSLVPASQPVLLLDYDSFLHLACIFRALDLSITAVTGGRSLLAHFSAKFSLRIVTKGIANPKLIISFWRWSCYICFHDSLEAVIQTSPICSVCLADHHLDLTQVPSSPGLFHFSFLPPELLCRFFFHPGKPSHHKLILSILSKFSSSAGTFRQTSLTSGSIPSL